MFGLFCRCHDSHHLFTACLGMDDSNYQTFASGYFSHLQIIKLNGILKVCKH